MDVHSIDSRSCHNSATERTLHLKCLVTRIDISFLDSVVQYTSKNDRTGFKIRERKGKKKHQEEILSTNYSSSMLRKSLIVSDIEIL